ncbi:hypothetical protein FOQG_17182 [Fusarium oxysporum f. sp. raphani 54005]|uniref:Uncharacterized protein n=2 Tax=Fusarium oxysporum TaxID=5507 RepID=X0BI38_FUSOX|nr:hypothetical protein FOMG_17105 [Fusarium oxysporum f. sp. melonis 26406]EXK78134.1 hypothetical protein FOQG_17182 [Fusarium oxysporum f. sp. raphani 54005]
MLDTYSGTGGVSREVPMAGCMWLNRCKRFGSPTRQTFPALPVLSIRSGIVPDGQTLGLARKRHSEPFNGSIGDLTQGYSGRWQVVRLYICALPKTEGA